MGCATCDELEYFRQDLLKCATATGCSQIMGQARAVCESIQIMAGHTARIIVNQERFWPETLEKMRKLRQYDHVLLKSDYWKKFEGTVMKQGKCKTSPKQSVETHSAWYLLPPKDVINIDWSVFPDGHEYVQPEADGFRGFIVEFINIISDVVV